MGVQTTEVSRAAANIQPPTLTAVLVGAVVHLQWTCRGIGTYEIVVERSTGITGPWARINLGGTGGNEDATVDAGARYFYQARVITGDLAGVPSHPVSVVIPPRRPVLEPARQDAQAGGLTLTWDLVPYVTTYKIVVDGKERATVKPAAAALLGTWSGDPPHDGQSHTYAVEAFVDGTSSRSENLHVWAVAPEFTPPKRAKGKLVLTATLPTPDDRQWNIRFEGLRNGDWVSIKTTQVGGGGNPFVATANVSRKAYRQFRVRAISQDSITLYSARVSAAQGIGDPVLVRNKVDVRSDQITINWNEVPGAKNYELHVRKLGDHEWRMVAAGPMGGATDDDVEPGTTYEYKLVASDGSGRLVSNVLPLTTPSNHPKKKRSAKSSKAKTALSVTFHRHVDKEKDVQTLKQWLDEAVRKSPELLVPKSQRNTIVKALTQTPKISASFRDAVKAVKGRVPKGPKLVPPNVSLSKIFDQKFAVRSHP